MRDGRFIIKKIIIPLLSFIFLSVAVFYPILKNFFFSDDFSWLFRADNLLYNWYDFIFLRFAGFLRTVVNFYFYITYHLFGSHPFYYYLVNILLHGVNGYLVYLLGKNITRQQAIGWLAAIIFICLYSHREAIMWISAVTSLIDTFFVLLAANLFWYYLENRNFLIYLLTLVALMTALLTKESSSILVVILSLEFLLFFKYKNWRRNDVIILLPLWAVTIIYLVVQYLYLFNNLAVYGYEYKAKISQLKILFFNTAHTIFGFENLSLITILFPALLLVVTLIFLKNKEYRRILLFFGGWILIASLPPIFFNMGSYNFLLASRYNYLISVGTSCLLATVIYLLYKFLWHKSGKLFIFLIVTALLLFNVYKIREDNHGYYKISQVSKNLYYSLGVLNLEKYRGYNVFIAGDFPFGQNAPYIYDMLQLYFNVSYNKIHFISKMIPFDTNKVIAFEWNFSQEKFIIKTDTADSN